MTALIKITISSLFICLIWIGIIGCEKKSVTKSGTEDTDEEIIRVSGILSSNASGLSRVGLLYIPWGKAITTNNSVPFAITTISNGEWSLSIPDITKDDAFNNLEHIGSSGGYPFYSFIILGWSDIDGDGRFDPTSGESSGYGHIDTDTIKIAWLYYVDNDANLPIDNWSVGRDKLKDKSNNWFIIDDSQIEPITKWIYRDSTYNFDSGLAEQTRSFSGDLINGLTVWLSTKDITCIDSPINTNPFSGVAWMNVRFPDLTIRSYGELEVMGFMRAGGSNIDGNLGRAGLVFVDTLVEKRVKGWIAFYDIGLFEDGEILVQAYGSFDVPFCSVVLDSAYFPTEPITSWQHYESEIPVVSSYAQMQVHEGYERLEIVFSDQNITCADAPFLDLPGSSLRVVYPNFDLNIYDGTQLMGLLRVPDMIGGYDLRGKAGITFADTTNENRIKGWLAIDTKRYFPNVIIYGTFDVSFCP
jgi:hypothetical protein